jgi:hypothetical protein
MRRMEFVFVHGSKSRLTITPERVTIKVASKEGDYVGVFYAAAAVIATLTDFDVSLRGVFDMKTRKIELYSGRRNRKLYGTYEF